MPYFYHLERANGLCALASVTIQTRPCVRDSAARIGGGARMRARSANRRGARGKRSNSALFTLTGVRNRVLRCCLYTLLEGVLLCLNEERNGCLGIEL